MAKFNSVLVANRGEIACRILRSAKTLGYRTVAVYSEADDGAPHMKMADDAICIGKGPVGDSYLVADKVIQAALDSGAQAIHPGYGFLSENAEFARACSEAGLTFIGPSAQSIDLMGNKAEAKRHMLSAEVPCVPGYEGHDQSDAALNAAAAEIGFPLMVKAAAGGGGRGMRLVEEQAGLAQAIKLARSEAENAFGSGELILEKAIIEPRHVEVQVFADSHGNTVHLGERDCSVQRRHQKVIEESPCPIMTPELRQQMGAAAVAAAQSIDYVGAGTVEFLLDADAKFYFLEMNTRLQVEHPVTELVTGLDLVALQFAVAQGDAIGFTQEEVALSGHAIEVRVYCEDPSQGFLPTAGPIHFWHAPQGEGIRVDGGIESGQQVSPFYDSMLAKIIAYGNDRETARRRLLEALAETSLFGVNNNLSFLAACLQKTSFIDGKATTAFIAREFSEHDLQIPQPSLEQAVMAAILQHERAYEQANNKALGTAPSLKNWSSASRLESHYRYQFDDLVYDLKVSPTNCSSGGYQVTDGVDSFDVSLIDHAPSMTVSGACRAQFSVGAKRIRANYWFGEDELHLSVDTQTTIFLNQLTQADAVAEGDEGRMVKAPMHGMVLEVSVEQGQSVKQGDPLLLLEAMKMQHQICALIDGEVRELHVCANQQVTADEVLVLIEPKD